jgi:hypothetical protein
MSDEEHGMKRSYAPRTVILSAGLALAIPALAQTAVVMPTIDEATGRILLKRGDAYLQLDAKLALQPNDSLVLFEGARIELNCGATTVASHDTAGIYAVPECAAQVAAAAPPPATTTPTAASTAPAAGTASGGVSKGWLLAAGLVATVGVVAASADDGDDDRPASP